MINATSGVRSSIPTCGTTPPQRAHEGIEYLADGRVGADDNVVADARRQQPRENHVPDEEQPQDLNEKKKERFQVLSPSSRARRNAAIAASITVALNLPRSNSWSAAAVVPPGEVTISRRMAGFVPDSFAS